MSRLPWFFLFLLLTACGSSGPPEPFHGEWRVASASTPGVAAVSAADAGRRVGTLVILEPGRARVMLAMWDGAFYVLMRN